MPTYDYECTDCGKPHQIKHAMTAEKPSCPDCTGALRQVFLTAPAINGAASGFGGLSGDIGGCDAPAGACGTGACPFQS